MRKEECNDISLIGLPSCSSDSIEDWFSNLQDKISVSNKVEQLICIIETANDVYKNCQRDLITKGFIKEAYRQVTSTARQKINRLQTTRDSDGRLSFGSGKETHSILGVIENQFKRGNEKLKNVWI